MGMIVPMSPGQKPNAPAQAMPSQTDLLMAVSEMHKQGRFAQSDDYDYQSAKAAGVKPDSTGHWPDTYKLPNHITFSDESKYHGVNGAEGGHWKSTGDDHWEFTPGKTNLENHSEEEMKDYFKRNEPKSKLILSGAE